MGRAGTERWRRTLLAAMANDIDELQRDRRRPRRVAFRIVGLTVGADVPASWTLITETAPNGRRGCFAGLAQVLWYVGAIAPLLLGIALVDLGMTATRIIFAHLFVVALVTSPRRSPSPSSACR